MLLSFAPQNGTVMMLLTSDVNDRSVTRLSVARVYEAVPQGNAMHMLSIR